MAPKVKFSKQEIVEAAVKIVREKGVEALTAREMAATLKVSTRPIFTYFDTMEQLKAEVFDYAKNLYKKYIERGLKGPIPFFGVGQEYIRFAREEPELYKILYLTKQEDENEGAMKTLAFSQDMVRDSIMRIYNMDADTADKYFRDLWLVVFSICTLIVTNECPYSDEEIGKILTEISLSVCKAYKEIPGLSTGDFDKDAIFRELVKK
ncbi:MAG: TetR/AcrR family transcriptional regulator [Clostridiales bacterium]|nr:TetR/AcrR family transcriptional regulator [Clostridiales bacterium]